MKWQLTPGNETLVNWFFSIGLSLFILNLFFNNRFLFIAASVLIAIGLYPRLYLAHVSRSFSLSNDREKLRLSQGDRGIIQLHLSNQSKLPIVSGEIVFSFNEHVLPLDVKQWNDRVYQFDFGLGAGEQQSYAITVKAVSRGLSKMKHLQVKIYDPLKIASLTLSYDFIRKDIVVYPNKKTVPGLRRLNLQIDGDSPRQTSLFQDRMAPIGVRDYLPGDPIHDVNWKASARIGRLQTKLYERTSGMIWTIIVLVNRELKKEAIARLEDQLAHIAHICHSALKQKIQAELYVNIKQMGHGSAYHLSAQPSSKNFQKALEFLSLIQMNQTKTQPLAALHEIDRRFDRSRVIIIANPTHLPLNNTIFMKWMNQGHKVWTLDENGSLNPVAKGVDRIAH
ncbi:DUF58 domain-containing protein [Camelliibacillus cellulosilyticus]|uniref:DUF58 domain-containing protein n=1 Tax=Camelliibacillus cellulosilyticus TaxID=2174486 RepID=A0ABV9GLB6_9BACL